MARGICEMVQRNVFSKWFGRNWSLAVTAAVLVIGVGVLLMRSSEFSHPPAVEAAVKSVPVVPSKSVIIPGRATIVLPGSDDGGSTSLVSDRGRGD
jgi:hypothetical protein